MTKPEYLEMCSHHWEDLQKLHRHDNLYDFEKEYVQMTREIARKSFEGILANLPSEYRKKTFKTIYGKIAIDNRNPLSNGFKGFKLSHYERKSTLSGSGSLPGERQ